MPEALAFSRELLLSPRKAVERLRRPGAALREAACIYAAFLAASVLFYAVKPADFPPLDGAQLPDPSQQGLLFWTKVQAWGPLLSAAWVALLAWFVQLMGRSSRLPLSLLAAAAFGMLPLAPILLYTNNVAGKAGLAAAWILIAAGMIPGLRRRPPQAWRRLASLVLGINAVNLALLVPFALAVLARSAPAYFALEILMLFWMLGLGSYLLGALEDVSTPRAFAALFCSMLAQLWLVFSLYFLGLVPKDVLKALLSV